MQYITEPDFLISSILLKDLYSQLSIKQKNLS